MKKERTKSFEFGKIDFYENGEKRYPVTVEISIGYEDGEMVFSAMADVWKSNRSDIIMGGQCLDDLLPFFTENKLFNEICRLWKLYHLNDMHAECEHQRELGWKEKARTEVIKYDYWLKNEFNVQKNTIKKFAIENLVRAGIVQISEEDQFILSLESYMDVYEPEKIDPAILSHYEIHKKETKTLGWVKPSEHSDGILCRPCPVCGYKYGTSWLLMPIPEDDKQKILKLFEEV